MDIHYFVSNRIGFYWIQIGGIILILLDEGRTSTQQEASAVPHERLLRRHRASSFPSLGRRASSTWAAAPLLPQQLRLFSRALNMRPAGERQLAWAWRRRRVGGGWSGILRRQTKARYEVACPVSCERRQCDRKTEARQRCRWAAMPASCGRRPARSSWRDGERRQVRAGEPRAEVAWSNSGGRRAAASFRRVFVVAGRHGWLMVYGLPLGAWSLDYIGWIWIKGSWIGLNWILETNC